MSECYVRVCGVSVCVCVCVCVTEGGNGMKQK